MGMDLSNRHSNKDVFFFYLTQQQGGGVLKFDMQQRHAKCPPPPSPIYHPSSMGMDPKIDTATLDILKFSFFFIYCSIPYVYTGLPLSQIGHVTWGLVTFDGGGYKDSDMRHGLFFNSTYDMWEYKGHATWSFLKPTCDIGLLPETLY